MGLAFTRRTYPIVTINARLTRDNAMIKRHQPVVGVMTAITSQRGLDMVLPLTGCNNTVVTAFTGPKGLRVVNSGYRYPGVVSMASVTGVGCGNMTIIFTAGSCTVMTALACSLHLGMIHLRGRNPRTYCVARRAIISGCDMIRRFANH